MQASRGAGKREELAALVKNTADPERKLQLWGAYHKAHVTADVARDKPGTDAESQRRHAARDTAAKSTHGEVDDEMAFMHQQVATTGKALSITDVNDLIARKDTEHAMEMKYNVNFTNEVGARISGGNGHAVGSHVHWESRELNALDKTFSRMPEAHLAGNAGLTDMHRQEKVFWNNDKTVEIGGKAEGTSVLIPDQSASVAPTGEKRQLADGSDISALEWMMTHELGHNVSGKYSAAYAKYQQVNGWQSHDADTDELTATQKAELESKRGNRFDNRASVTSGDTTYQIDQDTKGGYLSRAQGSIPEIGEAVAGPGSTVDPWAYARTAGNEQFGEHFDRSVHVPEKVYRDLVLQPHEDTQIAAEKLQLATTEADRRRAQEELTRKQQAETVRKESYDLMRNAVFGTNTAQTAAEARLTAEGISPERLKAFQDEAAGASTPAQLAVVEARFK